MSGEKPTLTLADFSREILRPMKEGLLARSGKTEAQMAAESDRLLAPHRAVMAAVRAASEEYAADRNPS